MVPKHGKVHVVRVKKIGYVDKAGRRRDYSSAYLRRTYRDGGTVKNETVATLSALPDHVIDLIDAGLKGRRLVPVGEAFMITRSLPHGHVAAVAAMARRLEFAALLGAAGRRRDLAMALVISQVVRPASGLSTLTWWSDVTLGEDMGVAGASADEVHTTMDWMASGRVMKAADLTALQARYRPADRDAPHTPISLLAAHLTWHLRSSWAPLIQPGSGESAWHSFRGLLAHLGTLTRSQIRFPGAEATVVVLSEPTPGQCAAFELIGTPIPRTVA